MVGDILQPTHLLFVLVVALLVLGPKRLPEVGKTLGTGLRDFRQAISGEVDNHHPAPAAVAEPAPAPAPPDLVLTHASVSEAEPALAADPPLPPVEAADPLAELQPPAAIEPLTAADPAPVAAAPSAGPAPAAAAGPGATELRSEPDA